jgi:hypothetical protein
MINKFRPFLMPLLLATRKFITSRRRHHFKVPCTDFSRNLGHGKSSPESLKSPKKETKLELIKFVITVDCGKHTSFNSY